MAKSPAGRTSLDGNAVRTQRTRERILAVSLALFNARGEAHVTTGMIADELNISPGNLYYHFRNKDQIVERLFDRFEERIALEADARLDGPGAIEDLWLYLHLMFEGIWAYRFLYRNLDDIVGRNRRLREHFNRIIEAKLEAVRRLCSMHGFQLWANLPSSLKMTAPRYQDVSSQDIPVITDDDGTTVRVICGSFWGKRGPVEGIAADPRYLDVWVPPGKRKTLPVESSRHAFAYIFEGSGTFRDASKPFGVLTEKDGQNDTLVREQTGNRSLVLFDSGDEVGVQAGQDGLRFLLVSGRPIQEPVAWYGPIVMNTQAELRQAYTELQDGTFIRGR